MLNAIVISTDVRQLPELGEAWLVEEDGTPRAKFYNGQLILAQPELIGNTEVTVPLAA